MCNLKDKRFEFMREPMAVSDFYSIVVGRVSNVAEFLELSLSIVGQQLRTRPFVKPSSLQQTLSVTSCHPWHVHEAWPIGRARRLIGLTCHATTRREAIEELTARYTSGHCHASSAMISKWWLRGARFPQERSPKTTLWLVLPYRPQWAQPLRRMVSKFWRDGAWSGMFEAAMGAKPLIKLAWRNAVPSHGMIMKAGAGT